MKTPEEIKDRIRQYRASQGVRTLELEEIGITGEDAIHVWPMTVAVRNELMNRMEKDKGAAQIWLVATMALTGDRQRIGGEAFWRNEGDPVLLDKIFSFIMDPLVQAGQKYMTRENEQSYTEESLKA